jgi:glyoxylase-like metal-dependent hydrolase (beta-lactamase superfamily II)
MHRRDLLKRGVGAVSAALLTGASARADDDPVAESNLPDAIRKAGGLFNVPVVTTKIAGHVTLVTGPGGNIALLNGTDGPLLVDSGVPDHAEEIRKSVESVARTPVAVLIDTHWHFDHAGGNAVFASKGAQVWAAPNTRKRLSTEQFNEAFEMKFPASPPEALPALTFEEAQLHVNGEELHLVAVPPAHTDGDLIIHFVRSNIVHCGDLVSNGFYPNIDASSRGWIGGMIAAVKRILEMTNPDTKVIPGHGPLGTVNDLRAYLAMLTTVYDKISPLVDAGKSVEDVIRARPTASVDVAWGKGLLNGPQFTRLVYGGLVKLRAEKGG